MTSKSESSLDIRYHCGTLRACLGRLESLSETLLKRGFIDKGGKGSHRNFVHSNCKRTITLSGDLGSDAEKYQERDVKRKTEESKP